MPSDDPCPTCGRRRVCPRCRALAAAALPPAPAETPPALEEEPTKPQTIEHIAAVIDHAGILTPNESPHCRDPLTEAKRLAARIAELEAEIESLRALRLEALRQATAGRPVAKVASDLGITRQRLHKLLSS